MYNKMYLCNQSKIDCMIEQSALVLVAALKPPTQSASGWL